MKSIATSKNMKAIKPADKLFKDFTQSVRNYETVVSYNKAEDGLNYTEGYESIKDYEESNE